MSDSSGPAIDESRFRQVLGHFPTGVTVVAAKAGDEPPVGLAVGSFFSISLEPPLVGFCPGKSSSSWPKIEAAGNFCVNILAEDQEDVARVFAGKGEDKFQSVGWRPASTGSPVIRDVLAWIDCSLEDVNDAGDHYIVTGRVHELKVEREGHPLVFFRGGYGSFASWALAVYALGDAEPEIHPTAYVHPDAVVIGRVHIGAESSIWPTAVLRGDDGDIFVGAGTSIQDGTIIHTTAFQPTTVGDRCVVGHNVHLEGCIVEDGSLVGSGSVVLHRAIVRTGSLVGANALVPGGMEVPTGAMALGVPAKLREDSVTPGQFEPAVESYIACSARFRTEQRRIS